MTVLRALRRRVHFILGPIVGIALTGYFAYHLVEGERGFKAWLRLNREIRTATANLETVRAQRAALDLRVSNLRPEHVDPDLPIGKNLCGKGILQHLTGSHRRNGQAARFEKIPDNFPGQLEGILKPLNDSFLFKEGQFGRTFL